MQQAFRQLEERSVSSEVILMEWSPKMDLIALANKNGEVLLQRLTWQKQPIWTLPPSTDDESITALAWRPDGKVLAVGYECGKFVLCSVEGAGIIHTKRFSGGVVTMKWCLTSLSEGPTSSENVSPFQDSSDHFLPKLPALTKMTSSTEDQDEGGMDLMKLKEQSGFLVKGNGVRGMVLNLLLINLDSGVLHILAYGIAPVAEINLPAQEKTANVGTILQTTVTPHLHSISVISVRNGDESDRPEIILVQLESVLLASRHQEIANYAKKYAKISALLEYLEGTLKAMTEAKEDILLEIEAKLTKYAEQKGTEGTVGDEFLDLLLWGKASLELQTFLLQELTAKGLKKLGHSVESSYSSIQKLILKQVHRVGKMLLFELSELYGLAKWYERYGILGLSPEAIQGAMSAVGSFLLKSNELLQVIEKSLKNFKAFFRWLFVQMMRMMEEPVVRAISKMYQKDINFVADFLEENFSQDISEPEGGSGFTLERVGQYFLKEDLSHPFRGSSNPWMDFTEAHPKLRESPFVFPNQTEKSLLQLHDALIEAVNGVLTKTGHICGQSVVVRSVHPLCHSPDLTQEPTNQERIIVGLHNPSTGDMVYSIFTDTSLPAESLYLVNYSTNTREDGCVRVQKLQFGALGISLDQSTVSQASTTSCQRHVVLDAAFYDDSTLSVLLQEADDSIQDCVSVLCQLPIASLESAPSISAGADGSLLVESQDLKVINASQFVSHYHRLDNLKAARFAVSGSRKVSSVLFLNGRRIRLFDMDTEEEDPSLMDSTMDRTQSDSDINVTADSIDV